jgi:hypothetical protein
MTLPVEWKLQGGPISREQLVTEWEDLHHRSLMKGPVCQFLVRCALLVAPTGQSAASPQLIAMVAPRCPKLSVLTCDFVGSRRSLI